ncbi:hypothetical protein N9242_02640 [Vicingaceae bacterium]|nr:hypothetical protein [Vicingaceae bacterium]
MDKFIEETIEDLEIMYCTIKKYDEHSEFLFSIELADNMEIDRLGEALKENNLTVSIQDEIIKIPSTKFSTEEDFENLVNCFRLCVSF